MNRNLVALVVLSLSGAAGCAEPDELFLGDLEESTDEAANGGSGVASCVQGSGGARVDAEGDAGEAGDISSAAAGALGGRGSQSETGSGGNSADQSSPTAGAAGTALTSFEGGSTSSGSSSHSGGSDATGGSVVSGSTGGSANSASVGGGEASGSTGGSANSASVGGGEALGSTGGSEVTVPTGGSGGSESSGGSAGLPDPGTNPVTLQVQARGYVLSGDWGGYAWVAADNAAVTPTDFLDHRAGEPLCIVGSVAASPEYSGIAGLGFNLNQAADSDTPAGWEATSEGLRYQIRNAMASELRLHLLGASGGDWCVWLATESGSLAWSEFRTECWSEDGTAYSGSEPIESIMVLVPGLAATDVPFDVCIEDLAPTDQVQGQPVPPEVCADSTGAGSGELAAGFEVAPGGYVTGQAIHGWAYVAAGSTSDESRVTPTDFAAHPGGAPLCISGTVGATEDYSDLAVIGINLNQGSEADAEVGLMSPSGVGISYDISNCGGSPLRLELLGESGMADSEERWCVDVTEGQGFVLWSEFNTTCWDQSGTAYDGVSLLASAQVIVPPEAEQAVPFDFCLNGLN